MAYPCLSDSVATHTPLSISVADTPLPPLSVYVYVQVHGESRADRHVSGQAQAGPGSPSEHTGGGVHSHGLRDPRRHQVRGKKQIHAYTDPIMCTRGSQCRGDTVIMPFSKRGNSTRALLMELVDASLRVFVYLLHNCIRTRVLKRLSLMLSLSLCVFC